MSSNIEHTNLAPVSETVVIDDLEFTFETGRVARQANGAVLVTCGETVTLVTAVAAGKPREGVNFLPLSCDYVEKTYAAGKIPHSFFRREGRLSTDEILVCRLMDRPIRPLFSDGWRFETQIVALVLSADKVNDPAINAINGASMALSISDIPFDGPIAAVRVGQVDGKLVCNPTYEQRAAGDLDLVVCVGPNGITMVEGEADFIGEDTLVEALFFAQEKAQPFLDAQHRIREKVGREKRVVEEPQVDGSGPSAWPASTSAATPSAS